MPLRRAPSRFQSWFHVEPAWAAFCAAADADSVAAFTALGQTHGTPVASGHHVNVWRTPLTVGDQEAVFYIKRYTYEDLPIRYWGRPSRAWIEYRNYTIFRDLGIPGPASVAVGERRSAGGLHQALVVTVEIPNCRNLAETIRLEAFGERADLRRRILLQAAHYAGLAHRRGFYHRDLKLRNILVQNFPSADCAIHWIDCPKGGFRRLNRGHFAVADVGDMARLLRPAVGAAEWQLFLECYQTVRDHPEAAATARPT